MRFQRVHSWWLHKIYKGLERAIIKLPVFSSGQINNHRYEPQRKPWTKIPQQAAGYYTFRLWRDCSTKLFAALRLQKASLTNKLLTAFFVKLYLLLAGYFQGQGIICVGSFIPLKIKDNSKVLGFIDALSNCEIVRSYDRPNWKSL